MDDHSERSHMFLCCVRAEVWISLRRAIGGSFFFSVVKLLGDWTIKVLGG